MIIRKLLTRLSLGHCIKQLVCKVEVERNSKLPALHLQAQDHYAHDFAIELMRSHTGCLNSLKPYMQKRCKMRNGFGKNNVIKVAIQLNPSIPDSVGGGFTIKVVGIRRKRE